MLCESLDAASAHIRIHHLTQSSSACASATLHEAQACELHASSACVWSRAHLSHLPHSAWSINGVVGRRTEARSGPRGGGTGGNPRAREEVRLGCGSMGGRSDRSERPQAICAPPDKPWEEAQGACDARRACCARAQPRLVWARDALQPGRRTTADPSGRGGRSVVVVGWVRTLVSALEETLEEAMAALARVALALAGAIERVASGLATRCGGALARGRREGPLG